METVCFTLEICDSRSTAQTDFEFWTGQVTLISGYSRFAPVNHVK